MSLSARRPRGRPPAVGVDSSFFNLTPPSAEAVTPTTEEPKPVISETVDTETSLTVKTKAQPDDRPTSITIGDGPLQPDRTLINGIQAPVATQLEKPEFEKAVTTERVQSETTDSEKPVTTGNLQPISSENVQPMLSDNVQPVPTENVQPVSTGNVQPVSTENVQSAPTGNVQPVSTENVQPVSTEDRLAGESVAPVTEEGKEEESTDKISLPTGEQVDRFVKAAPLDVNPNPHS